MKKVMIVLSCLSVFSCVSNKIQEDRQPAQTGNVGSFLTSKVGGSAVVCSAVCEIYIPMNTTDPKIKLMVGSYLSGRELMVSNGSTVEAAVEKLRNKCAEASPKYRIYKALDVDLSEEAESLSDKYYNYDPSQQLSSSNSQEFCQTSTLTEFIHYASGKLVNKNAMKFKIIRKVP